MKRTRINIPLNFWRLVVAVAHHLACPWVNFTNWAEWKLEAAERRARSDDENDKGGDDDGA